MRKLTFLPALALAFACTHTPTEPGVDDSVNLELIQQTFADPGGHVIHIKPALDAKADRNGNGWVCQLPIMLKINGKPAVQRFADDLADGTCRKGILVEVILPT